MPCIDIDAALYDKRKTHLYGFIWSNVKYNSLYEMKSKNKNKKNTIAPEQFQNLIDK
jgi:hypothetical protein